MKYRTGDILICIKSSNNTFGWPLFIKGNKYKVLYVDNGGLDITLNHILYANEYGDWPVEFVNECFISTKENRRRKLKKIDKNL